MIRVGLGQVTLIRGCHNETINYDWHDGVLCTNGLRSDRPYLLEGYDFVTYEDMMSEAARYESYLNSL